MKNLITKFTLGMSGLALAATPLLGAGGGGEHHSLSVAAEELFRIGPLPVTNSMVTAWVVCLFIVALIRWMVGKPQLIPTKGNLWRA